MSLGEFIRKAREDRGLSQSELAKLSGVSRAAIRTIEQGVVKTIRFETAVRIAEVLHVSLDGMAKAARKGQFETAAV